MQTVRTAVVGATGYSGQELLRYLARHPVFQVGLVTSRQNAGEPLAKSISGLPREMASLTFIDTAADFSLGEKADLFFLAVPHGTAAPYAVALREAGKTVVDLSADFRTADPAVYKEFYDHEHPAPYLLPEAVYGIPEIHRERLKSASLIAAPGCFPTSIILPLVPFLSAGLIEPDSIVISSLSGVSGAGRKLELRLLFGEVNDNMYAYGVPKHRHLGEIEQELSLAAKEKIAVTFVPHLIPIHRGMLSTIAARLRRPQTDAELLAVLQEAYGQEPFVEILATGLPEARQVAHSNRIQIAARIDARTNRLLLFSSIDNLGKGNASQAIQAANLACGLDETARPPLTPMEAKTIKGGGVTSAQGFRAAGIASGIKPDDEKDLALIVSDLPAEAAATFTTNLVKAAPVKLSMRHVRKGKIRGVVLNAGCANACTGIGGIADAKSMADHVAKEFNTKPREWLVCSTGRIGTRLPMPLVRKGIEKAASKLDFQGGSEAAKAIMTSDTRSKEFAMSFKVDGRKVTIGGMAKGAGMIHPNMATMLCLITTDACIDKATLQGCVDEAVEHSFNRISVDGDMSTNDTVIVLANGLAETNLLKSYHPQFPIFKKTLTHVMRKLARLIVEDGEGITHVVDVVVKGAISTKDARLSALAICKSELVKTSWTGGDPNWGRIMAALGYSGARVREEMIEIYYDGVLAVVNGQPSKTPLEKLRKIAAKPIFTITVHLHSGTGEYSILTTDLTEEYVRLNKGE